MNSQEHKVLWDECEIHHITPHAKGGTTSIDNAALVHKDCHPKSGNRVREFEEWWTGRKSDEMTDPHRKTQQRGQLPPEGTKIKFKHKDQNYTGEIKNSKIILTGKNETYKSFSEASRAVTSTNRNGWNDWLLLLPNEKDYIHANSWRKGEKIISLDKFLK